MNVIQIKDHILVNADCLVAMPMLPDKSVHLTVTSPPYDNLRAYDGSLVWTWDVFKVVAEQLFRVTAPGGIVVWIVSDATTAGSETGTSFRQALHFKDIGFNLHDTMIWNKPDPTPQQQHPRYQPAFEYMFVFCKGYPPRVFNPLLVPTKHAGQTIRTSGQRNADDTFRHPEGKTVTVKTEKFMSNVWTIWKQAVKGHPAPFPEALVRDHIVSWSNPGDVVLDPFLGSGTTGKVAALENRRFVGIEKVTEYFDIARQRIEAVSA